MKLLCEIQQSYCINIIIIIIITTTTTTNTTTTTITITITIVAVMWPGAFTQEATLPESC